VFLVLLIPAAAAWAKVGPNPGAAGAVPCAPRRLHVEAFLQGATGSMLGELRFRNDGRDACAVQGPLRLVLLDRAGRPLPLARVHRPGPEHGQVEVGLGPGWSASAELQLFNACNVPSGSRLWVVLAYGEGRIQLRISAGGRCDAPGKPPKYLVGRFEPAVVP
jgi:hypothetical protein